MAGHRDKEGNWVEDFTSQPYDTEEEARSKIQAVYNAHVVEGGHLGWALNGEPRVEMRGSKYVAIVPLIKYENGQNKQHGLRGL